MNLDKKAKILRKMYSWQMSLITLLHSPVNCNLKTSQKRPLLNYRSGLKSTLLKSESNHGREETKLN